MHRCHLENHILPLHLWLLYQTVHCELLPLFSFSFVANHYYYHFFSLSTTINRHLLLLNKLTNMHSHQFIIDNDNETSIFLYLPKLTSKKIERNMKKKILK